MMWPLSDYNRIAYVEFYTDTEARRLEYCEQLRGIYDIAYKKEVDGEKGIWLEDAERKNNFFIKESDTPIVECYEAIENTAKARIRRAVLEYSDTKKIRIFIKSILDEIGYLLSLVTKLKLPAKFEEFRSEIKLRVSEFINFLKNVYIDNKVTASDRKLSIKWLGTKNQLATLFYDLSKGVEVIDEQHRKQKLPPLIKASKADLMTLIEIAFVDKNGDPFSHTSLSEVLTEGLSKVGAKASGDKRISLNYK